MSRRTAARWHEISESPAIKRLERYRPEGSRGPAGHGGYRRSMSAEPVAYLIVRRAFMEFANVGVAALLPPLSFAFFHSECPARFECSCADALHVSSAVAQMQLPGFHAARIAGARMTLSVNARD
jgi:hypothetical protein